MQPRSTSWMHNPEITHYGVVVSRPTVSGLWPEYQGSPKIHGNHLQKGLSCSRREIILSCRARNISACSWNVGMLVGSLSPPRHSSDWPSPRHRGGPCVRRHGDASHFSGGALEHDRTTAAETDVWDCSHKQGWRNLKPARYCSTSPFVRGIKSKVHWMAVTFSKWFLCFGTHCFHAAF